MKKFFETTRFALKALFLILILLVGWVLVNVSNLVKGKKPEKGIKDLSGIKSASADAPSSASSSSSESSASSGCPFIALYNGKGYVMENDFLPSEYKDFSYITARSIDQKDIPPDLLMLSRNPQKKNGLIPLRLEEIEPEESFIRQIRLLRIAHPRSSFIAIDSIKRIPHVLDKEAVDKEIKMPSRVTLNGQIHKAETFETRDGLHEPETDIRKSLFRKDDELEFVFENLNPDKENLLFIRSAYRDWFPGESKSFYAGKMSLNMAKLLIAGLFYLLLEKKIPGSGYLAPFIIGSGTMSKSILLSYKTPEGFTSLAVQKPRAYRSMLETIIIPKEAIGKSGVLTIRAKFTKKHSLSFMGIAEEPIRIPFVQESLKMTQATHSRVGSIQFSPSAENEELHLIPGDQVEINFEPLVPVASDQKETYLFQSSGFYTNLRPRFKRIAGNWEGKLSSEAKKHLANLKNSA